MRRPYDDTPCTQENQIQLLYESGFRLVEKIYQNVNTVILLEKNKSVLMEA